MLKTVVVVAAFMGCASVHAQQYLMMPDSTNNRVALFNVNDGSLFNGSYFPLAAGTPVHAMQVGSEIWVSEQIGDRISRWSLTGAPLGAITGGMDNVRGMEQVGNTIYLTNGGAANGSPGANSVLMFDTTGTPTGSFITTGLAPSPFSALEHQGDLLVGTVSGGSDVHRFTLAGVSVGVFHDSAALSFVEQMSHATNGDVLVAGFTTGGITRLDASSGAVISSFTASNPRGVYQLGNGNIIWSNGSGASVYNVTTQTSTLVYPGGGRFFDVLSLAPTCGTADFDGDGDVGTDADIEAFFACLGGNCCATCFPGGADFNQDGDVGTDADIEAFFRVLGGGNC